MTPGTTVSFPVFIAPSLLSPGSPCFFLLLLTPSLEFVVVVWAQGIVLFIGVPCGRNKLIFGLYATASLHASGMDSLEQDGEDALSETT